MKTKIFLFISLLCISACKSEVEERGNAVSGTFTLFCDNSSYPLIKVLTETYCSLYPEVAIQINTGNGSELMEKLSSHQAYSAVTCRYINNQDSLALNSRNIFFKQFHFATDALALIMNKSDSITSQNQNYNSLFTHCKSDTIIKICTDDPASDNNLTIKNLIPDAAVCMHQWMSFPNGEGVHDFVSKNRGSIGIVSWSFMCDTGDPQVKKLRDAVSILPLTGMKSKSKTFFPVQSAVADGEYPLTKKLYLVTTEPYSGPASGFAAFVASSEGQRIIRLFGIQPASIPTREIEIY